MLLTGERRADTEGVADLEGQALALLVDATKTVGGSRGLVALLDRATGDLFTLVSVGLDVRALGTRALTFPASRRHPLVAVAQSGEPRHVDGDEMERGAFNTLRRAGFRSALAIPIPGEAVSSPCLATGRCLSRECVVRVRTASASADAEWAARVSKGCVRAVTYRTSGVVVVETARPSRADRERITAAVGRFAGAVRRFPAPEPVRGAPVELIEEEWMRRAFSAVDDPIVVADASGTLSFANIRAQQLFVASPDDSEGRRRAVDFNRLLLAAWLSSTEGDRSGRPRELGLVDPEQGGELLFELIASTAHNSVARQTATVLVLKDVSDLRHAIEEVESTARAVDEGAFQARRERDQLNLILETIAQPIVVADLAGGSTPGVLAASAGGSFRMNSAARRLLEARSSAAGRERDVVTRNDAIVTSLISRVGISEGAAQSEVTLADPMTGETRTYAAQAALAGRSARATAAVVCVLSDLTEVRELERRRLERQLFESEKLAATGRLAASIAHEINNPLEAMKNALYLLGGQLPEDHPQRRFVTIARDEADRISSIVRQLLGFYRPSLTRSSTDLNALVKETADFFRAELRRRKVREVLDLDADLPAIVASPDQLKQVFLNLLLNAIQAMPGGGTITVTTRSRQRAEGRSGDLAPAYVGGDAAIVSFKDTGPGLLAEAQQHLFEPFFTTKEKGGTGLGLWICHEIIRAHGGTIDVHSAADVGTTFTIALPLVPPAEVSA